MVHDQQHKKHKVSKLSSQNRYNGSQQCIRIISWFIPWYHYGCHEYGVSIYECKMAVTDEMSQPVLFEFLVTPQQGKMGFFRCK